MHKNQSPKYSPFQIYRNSHYLEKDQFVLCDTSTSYPRPFVPCTLRKSIFDSLHAISHPGIKSSIKMIKARFYWPHMDKTIKELCASCTSCQQANIYRHTKSPVQTLEIPSSRFHTVHIDKTGPLPPAKCSNNPYNQSMSVCFNMYRSNQSMDRSTTYIGYYSTNRSRSFCKHVDYGLWCSTPCHIRKKENSLRANYSLNYQKLLDSIGYVQHPIIHNAMDL